MKHPRLANIFISAIAIGGLAMLGGSVLKMTALHPYQFVALLVLGAITSRTKLKLPGIDGTMSMNLPFILIAAAQLSLFEAVSIALVSAVLQSVPKRGGEFQAVKVLFNASTIVLSAGLSALLLHGSLLNPMHWSGPAMLVVACGMFFVANTLPVATIIAITENSSLLRIWSGIVHLSFPYYVACMGVTSMVTAMSRQVGWRLPLGLLPVMLLMYWSFQRYFENGTPAALPLARAAAAH